MWFAGWRMKRYARLACALSVALSPIVAIAAAPTASAEVTGTTGNIVQVTAPTSVRMTQNGGASSSTDIIAFNERRAELVPSGVSVDINLSGTYDKDHQTLNSRSIQGTTVDSYLLHWQRPAPIPAPTDFQILTGSITFDSDIVGLQVLEGTLDAGDPSLGAFGTTYPTNDATGGARGLDFTLGLTPPSNDQVTLSADR